MSARAFRIYDTMRAAIGSKRPRQYWGGLDNLAWRANTSTDTALRGVQELEARGWIIFRERKHDALGHQYEVIYDVLDHDEWLAASPNPERMRKCPDKPPKKMGPQAHNLVRTMRRIAQAMTQQVARREQRESAGEVVAPVPSPEERAQIVERFNAQPKPQTCGVGSDEPKPQSCQSLNRNLADEGTSLNRNSASPKPQPCDAKTATLRSPIALQSLKEHEESKITSNSSPDSKSNDGKTGASASASDSPFVSFETFTQEAKQRLDAIKKHEYCPDVMKKYPYYRDRQSSTDWCWYKGGKRLMLELCEYLDADVIVNVLDTWISERPLPIDSFPGDWWRAFIEECIDELADKASDPFFDKIYKLEGAEKQAALGKAKAAENAVKAIKENIKRS